MSRCSDGRRPRIQKLASIARMESHPVPKARLHYIDGLRGWAALAVMLSHMLQLWLLPLTGLQWLVLLVNRTPLGPAMDGTYAVYIFFVLSGLVLSYPTLVSGQRYKTLAGMVMNRYARLTIPIMAATLLAQAFWSAGMLHNHEVGLKQSNAWLAFFYNFDPRPGEIWRFGFFGVYFDWDIVRNWNGAMASMRSELQGSFLIFALLVLPSIWLRIPVCLYALYLYGWSLVAGMFTGYLLAECIIRLAWLETPSRRRSMIGLGCIAIAIGMDVVHCAYGPFNLWPHDFVVLLQVSATLLVLGVTLSGTARWLLEARLSQFMASISFPLYLVHLPVIFGIGCGLYVILSPYIHDSWMIFVVGIPTTIAAFGTAIAFRELVEDRAVLWAKIGILWLRDQLWALLILPAASWVRTLSPVRRPLPQAYPTEISPPGNAVS